MRNFLCPVPRSFARLPRSFARLPRGFARLPRSFARLPRGFARLPCGFARLPRGFARLPRGFACLPRSFARLPRGFRIFMQNQTISRWGSPKCFQKHFGAWETARRKARFCINMQNRANSLSFFTSSLSNIPSRLKFFSFCKNC